MPETVDKKLKSCLKKPSAKPPKKPTATKKSPFDYPIASATPIHERFQDGRTVSSRIKPPEKLAQDSGIDCAIASGTPTKERPKLRRNPSSRTKKPAIKTTARPQQKGRKVSFPEPKGGTGQAKHPARNLQGSANDPAEYDSKLPPRKPVIPGHEANCNCYQCGGLFGIDTEQQQNPSSLQKQNSVNDDLEIMVGQSNHVPTVAGRWAEDDPIRMPGHGRDCVCHQCDRLLFRKLVGREPMPQRKSYIVLSLLVVSQYCVCAVTIVCRSYGLVAAYGPGLLLLPCFLFALCIEHFSPSQPLSGADRGFEIEHD